MPEIKNLNKAVKRIKKAIKDNENIVLFSDSDLDGTTSLIILEQAIRTLGGKISGCFFPDREKQGYSLNKKDLKIFKKYSPGLLIMSDCGIASFKEVSEAQKMGFEVIIIEHHEVLKELPTAEIIVDPKQKEDKYPFKFLAACGICLKISRKLLGEKISPSLEKDLFILSALGTIADKMPQTDDNKEIIEKGLKYFPFSFREGIRAFFKSYPNDSLKEVIQKIISLLQITKVNNHLTESYIFLNSLDEGIIKKMMDSLLREQNKRRVLIQRFLDKMGEDNSNIIIQGSKDIPLSITGSLASRAYSKFRKPSFIFGYKGKIIRGSARAGKDVNTVEALKSCSSLLETFGGHPPASGFSLKEKNLKAFKESLKKYFNNL